MSAKIALFNRKWENLEALLELRYAGEPDGKVGQVLSEHPKSRALIRERRELSAVIQRLNASDSAAPPEVLQPIDARLRSMLSKLDLLYREAHGQGIDPLALQPFDLAILAGCSPIDHLLGTCPERADTPPPTAGASAEDRAARDSGTVVRQMPHGKRGAESDPSTPSASGVPSTPSAPGAIASLADRAIAARSSELMVGGDETDDLDTGLRHVEFTLYRNGSWARHFMPELMDELTWLEGQRERIRQHLNKQRCADVSSRPSERMCDALTLKHDQSIQASIRAIDGFFDDMDSQPDGAYDPTEFDDRASREWVRSSLGTRFPGPMEFDEEGVAQAYASQRQDRTAKAAPKRVDPSAGPPLNPRWTVTMPGGQVMALSQFLELVRDRQRHVGVLKRQVDELQEELAHHTEGEGRRTSLRDLSEIAAYKNAKGKPVGARLLDAVGVVHQALAEQLFQLDQNLPRMSTSEDALIKAYRLQSEVNKTTEALEQGYERLIALAGPGMEDWGTNEAICDRMGDLLGEYYDSPDRADGSKYAAPIARLRSRLEPLSEYDDLCRNIIAVLDGTQQPGKTYPVPEWVYVYQIPIPTSHGAVDQVTAPTPRVDEKWKGSEVAGYKEVPASEIGPGKGAKHCRIYAIDRLWRNHVDGRGGFTERAITKENVMELARGYCKQWWE